MFSGKNSLNSAYNCAARVLLCDITSVFLFVFATTFAIVNVLPLPVTPRSVCLPPFFTLWASFSMASGWSPLGANTFARMNLPVDESKGQ